MVFKCIWNIEEAEETQSRAKAIPQLNFVRDQRSKQAAQLQFQKKSENRSISLCLVWWFIINFQYNL